MLPPVPDVAAWRALRRDAAAQRPAIAEIARRHGLPAAELEPFDRGTHLAWASARSVIKLFVPLWAADAGIETTLLERVAGTALPVPQLEARGELAGWRYVVMSRVPGTRIGEAWPALDENGRERLAMRLGEAMAGIAALPADGLERLAVTQDQLVAERRERLVADQRERGGDDALEAELRAFLGALAPLPPAPTVLLHADLTGDNVLVVGTEVTGIIDFADAFVGPATYELAAPACFVTRGAPRHRDAMLRGRGFEPRDDTVAAVRAWAVLHRYGHLAHMMRAAGTPTLDAFLAGI